MSDDHIKGGGFTSPSQAERLEHAEISGVHGKKVFLVGSNGETPSVTDGKLDVNASVSTIGLSTSAKQDTIIGHIDGVETLLGTIDTDTGSLASDITSVMGIVDEVIIGSKEVLDTRAVLFAKRPNETYGNIQATPGSTYSIADDTTIAPTTGVPAGPLDVPFVTQALLVTTVNTGTCQLRFRSETTAITELLAGVTMVVERLA